MGSWYSKCTNCKYTVLSVVINFMYDCVLIRSNKKRHKTSTHPSTGLQKSKSSWPTRCGIAYMDTPEFKHDIFHTWQVWEYPTILWGYGCMQVRPNNFSKFDQKILKTQHNLATSLRTKILKRDMGMQIEGKCSQCWCPGRPDWMSETDRTDGCRTLLVKSTSVSSFCCSSRQCSWQPWQTSGHYD